MSTANLAARNYVHVFPPSPIPTESHAIKRGLSSQAAHYTAAILFPHMDLDDSIKESVNTAINLSTHVTAATPDKNAKQPRLMGKSELRKLKL